MFERGTDSVPRVQVQDTRLVDLRVDVTRHETTVQYKTCAGRHLGPME